MTTTARIVVGSVDAKVYVSIHLKDIVKAVPGRRWVPEARCWVVQLAFVDETANAPRAAGCTVFVTNPDGSPWSSGRASAGHRSTAGPDWSRALLEAVGPERAGRVFSALARILHPVTAGGDVALMSALNDARRRVGRIGSGR
jgi:hypothetical protein